MTITLLRLLQYLERLEQKAELLYRRLAGRFAEDSAVALAFARLADQEKGHRDLILFQSRMLKGSDEVFEKIDFNVNEMLDLTDEIDRAMSRDDLTLPEACELCLRMENSLGERHREAAVLAIGGDLLTLMKSLLHDDEDHAALLAGMLNPGNREKGT